MTVSNTQDLSPLMKKHNTTINNFTIYGDEDYQLMLFNKVPIGLICLALKSRDQNKSYKFVDHLHDTNIKVLISANIKF